jgi:hypothetical protein
MKLERTFARLLLAAAVAFSMAACGVAEDDAAVDAGNDPNAGDIANYKYDVLTFTIAGGQKIEVPINGLPIEAMKGGKKVEGTTWEIVDRRGVRLSQILDKAGITADDSLPVNLIGRDGYDALRVKIQDTAKLPTLGFMRQYAYVYAGDPGSKDPLYPELGSNSLIVDYNLASDADVPAYLGGTIASLSTLRMKMMEKIDTADFGEPDGVAQGLVEIDPVYTPQQQ